MEYSERKGLAGVITAGALSFGAGLATGLISKDANLAYSLSGLGVTAGATCLSARFIIEGSPKDKANYIGSSLIGYSAGYAIAEFMIQGITRTL